MTPCGPRCFPQVESDYGKPGGKPTLSITAWVQYTLDNFASVKVGPGRHA
jgi:penicillin V acylase-like amidase (Ntn superfamily)